MTSVLLIEYILEKEKEENKECSDHVAGKSAQCPFIKQFIFEVLKRISTKRK